MRLKSLLFSVVLVGLAAGVTHKAMADDDDHGGLSFSFGFAPPVYYQPPPPVYYQPPPPPVYYRPAPPDVYYAPPPPPVYYQPHPAYWGHHHEEEDDD
ncbi:MAG: hypothetical protein B7Z75_11705 [Acidocella sp. 20-57-95]|nr:MAG: hypothetical protein B7Z75_11705 [Acidocella sp. 20-57-95]OYV57973.1 MAG: hypothetical protein B7Z71_11485 [Acidocella sp. 21-58-7]HQT63134.1 hypothetical protein [Acidocella sp.]